MNEAATTGPPLSMGSGSTGRHSQYWPAIKIVHQIFMTTEATWANRANGLMERNCQRFVLCDQKSQFVSRRFIG